MGAVWTANPGDPFAFLTVETITLSRQEARLLVLIIERLERDFANRFSSDNEDRLYRLYEKLHLFSDAL